MRSGAFPTNKSWVISSSYTNSCPGLTGYPEPSNLRTRKRTSLVLEEQVTSLDYQGVKELSHHNGRLPLCEIPMKEVLVDFDRWSLVRAKNLKGHRERLMLVSKEAPETTG